MVASTALSPCFGTPISSATCPPVFEASCAGFWAKYWFLFFAINIPEAWNPSIGCPVTVHSDQQGGLYFPVTPPFRYAAPSKYIQPLMFQISLSFGSLSVASFSSSSSFFGKLGPTALLVETPGLCGSVSTRLAQRPHADQFWPGCRRGNRMHTGDDEIFPKQLKRRRKKRLANPQICCWFSGLHSSLT